MIVFLDSSAIYAYYDADDNNHAAATIEWQRAVDAGATIVTTNYVLLEVAALLQKRLGLSWVARLHARATRFLEVVWVDEELHAQAVEAAISADRRRVSLIDHLSLEVMRRHNIQYALAFDKHFAEAGHCLPPLDDQATPDEQDNPD